MNRRYFLYSKWTQRRKPNCFGEAGGLPHGVKENKTKESVRWMYTRIFHHILLNMDNPRSDADERLEAIGVNLQILPAKMTYVLQPLNACVHAVEWLGWGGVAFWVYLIAWVVMCALYGMVCALCGMSVEYKFWEFCCIVWFCMLLEGNAVSAPR